jgi:hypothetical protein
MHRLSHATRPIRNMQIDLRAGYLAGTTSGSAECGLSGSDGQPVPGAGERRESGHAGASPNRARMEGQRCADRRLPAPDGVPVIESGDRARARCRRRGHPDAHDHSREHARQYELQSEATGALENIRDLARGIYPPLLADQGLIAALSSQGRKAPLPVTIDGDGVGRYPEDAEAAVYFCCLEALQNVAKYAGAERVVVRLREDRGLLTFEVADDGVGFDPKAKGYGTGLQGMADRLAALAGELSVKSSVGAGTTVMGSVPITAGGPDPADGI